MYGYLCDDYIVCLLMKNKQSMVLYLKLILNCRIQLEFIISDFRYFSKNKHHFIIYSNIIVRNKVTMMICCVGIINYYHENQKHIIVKKLYFQIRFFIINYLQIKIYLN